MNRTNLIVLRKSNYRETSLIVSGITPDSGRLDTLVKGAKKLSAKHFPAVDLFREINVELKPGQKGLNSVYSADLISNYDNIASFHQNYLAACDIASFVLRNSQPDMSAPELYKALKHVFSILATEKMTLPYTALIKLVYLYEEGLLPELPERDDVKTQLLADLLGAASGKNKLPDLDQEYWQQLNIWIEMLCKFHELI